MKIAFGVSVGGAFLLASVASAAPKKAPESPLIREIAACKQQVDDAARLACYDKTAAALTDATASGAVVVVEREDVRKTRRSLFGFSLPKLPFFSGDDSQDDKQDELTSTIVSAGSIGHEIYRIRLEDGAIWETTEGSPAVRDPKKGDTVVIKRGALGNYMMRIAGQRALRARRVG